MPKEKKISKQTPDNSSAGSNCLAGESPEDVKISKRQPYERALANLAQRIFFREDEPGTKLPTERQLALDLNVDRTSLRVALKHLESMKVLDIRQGGGIYVRDYQKHAGIEFISNLFEILEAEGKLEKIDQYLMEETWEFWITFMPEILKLAVPRHTIRDLRGLMEIFDEELKCIDDRDKVADLEVKSQDLVADVAKNLLISLLMNTSRTLRRRMLSLFFHVLDEETIRAHIQIKQELVYQVMRTGDMSAVPELYGQALREMRQKMRLVIFKS